MHDRSLTLADCDPELAAALRREEQRQEDHIELIASENYASPQVMAVQNSVFTNKYAEGYPGRLSRPRRAAGRLSLYGVRLEKRKARCRRRVSRSRTA